MTTNQHLIIEVFLLSFKCPLGNFTVMHHILEEFSSISLLKLYSLVYGKISVEDS